MTKRKREIPRGVVVTDLHKRGRTGCKRFLIRVRDRVARGYRTETYDDLDQGLDWADDEQAKMRLGIAGKATISLKETGAAYLAELTKDDATARHKAQVQQVIDGLLGAGATDIKDPLFHDRVVHWLGGLKAQRHFEGKQRKASASLKAKFAVLAKALAKYAWNRGWVPHDPLAALKVKRPPKAAKETYTIPEMRALVSEDRKEDGYYLLAALVCYTGARATIAKGITWGMIDWDANVVRIPADMLGNRKGLRELRVPIQEELADILKPLAKDGAGQDHPHDQTIVPKRIADTPGAIISQGFKQYVGRCGFTAGNRSTHAARHTVAAILTAMGMSPNLVADYLGHTSSQVTKDYSANARDYAGHVAAWAGQFYFKREAPKAQAKAS